MEQQAGNIFCSVDGSLVSSVSMAEYDDLAGVISALCEMVNKVWTQERRVQAPDFPSVKLHLVREIGRTAAERNVVVNFEESGLSSCSISKKSAARGRLKRRIKNGERT